MKAYCQKCGHGTNFTSQKPKFCSFCGDSFSGEPAKTNSSIASARATVDKPKPKLEFELSTEGSENGFEDMDGLAFEVERTRTRKLTLEQIAGTSDQNLPIIDRPKAYSRKRVSKKQILADFKKEAGTTGREQSSDSI